jgi:mono/diheme cytochrome c family protein
MLATRHIGVIRGLLAMSFCQGFGVVVMGAGEVSYNQEIRPILASKCFACHGPDEEGREAGLRLDVEAEAHAEVIVPGDVEGSELWRRLVTDDPHDVMPPPSSPKALAEEERELIRRWIAAGARYEEHWSFLPVRRSAVPVLTKGLVRNAVDAFVLRDLHGRGFEASAEADAVTLVRRVYLDLTGLPPSAGEVAQFVKDYKKGEVAYVQLVDRLLESPHFGEKWGRHWLDLARYADSDGFLGDKVRPSAFRFRDWVIRAINEDLPFDQFTVQQLAGDLLPEKEAGAVMATGFHRNAAMNTEAGVDKVEARYQNLVDRLNTTGRVWLGLTIGCAQCHTHKYDPVTIRDYYELLAFFNNTEDRDDPVSKAPGLREKAAGRERMYVHLAGDYTRRGADVVPATLSALPTLEGEGAEGELSRLDLGRWLVAEQNPLTSRVAVNHVWARLFGTGLVATLDDFGATGEAPSHPELLDWLAVEFQRLGWSRKGLIRLIVLSATYRQASRQREDLLELDPLNRWLARQNRVRLEAELVRDAVLTVSGLLTRDVGGAGIHPPMPGDIFDVGRSVKWEESQGQQRYRRGLYIVLLRSVIYPMLTMFDAPDASEACAKRDRSNTPLQALTLLNDPVFFEAALELGRRGYEEGGGDLEKGLSWMFQQCFGRRMVEVERERLMAVCELAAAEDAGAAQDLPIPAREELDAKQQVILRGLVLAGRVMMNLDEFINRP